MAAPPGRALSLHPLRGHDDARKTLAEAHARGSLPAALLVHGPRGVGKQHLALWLARLLVCDAPEGGPCERCPPCRMARSLEHPDVHWYFPLPRPKRVSGDRLADALEDARHEALAERRADPLRPSHSDDVRGLYVGTVRNVRARAHKRPTLRGPVFIIGDAELLVPQEASQEAANALLKLLEEPPGEARFILTSSEPGQLLPTIRSRTVPLHVGGLPDDEVAALLRDLADAPPERATRAAALARGSVGRALGFLPDGDDDGPLEAQRQRALRLVEAALAPEASAGHAEALRFPPAGARGLLDLFSFVEEWVRDLGAVAAGAEDSVFHRDALETLRAAVARSAVEAVHVPVAFSRIEWARELAKANVNPQLVVSGLVRDLRSALRRPDRRAVVGVGNERAWSGR